MKAENNIEYLLLDFPKAAKRLDISVSFLHILDKTGRIVAPVKIGSRRLFSVKSLENWIDLGCPNRVDMTLARAKK